MYLRNRNGVSHADIEPYVKLGNAIILQAVKEYRAALRCLKRSPNNSGALYTKKEVEEFFHSGLFSAITDLDPDMLIRKLNQEVK